MDIIKEYEGSLLEVEKLSAYEQWALAYFVLGITGTDFPLDHRHFPPYMPLSELFENPEFRIVPKDKM